eukprot:scaffold48937_cov33-Phaeocystis_antarctica.AAC.1
MPSRSSAALQGPSLPASASASAYRLRCYAEAQLAGQHALLKPLDYPVELSPGQCPGKSRAALQSSGQRSTRKLLGGTTLGQACGRG